MQRFDGKTAIVTGAASGIGRATARRLAEEGAHVVCSDVQAEAVEDTAKAISAEGGRALALVSDVSSPEAVKSLVDAAVARLGGLDVLCNVAGILRFEHTHEATLDDWNQILAVNLTGTFLMCREALPHLLARRGNIVNLSSTAALAGHPWTAAYSASKGGVLAFTRTLAVEYGRQGLRANALCPGGIETPIQQAFALPEGADPKLLQRIMPLDRMRGPEEVASAIAYLASDEAAHVNGIDFRIDGATLS